MKTLFTFNPTNKVIRTRQQARKAAKLVSKLIGMPCTGADKKRDNGWSFDVACSGDVQKKIKTAKRVYRVEGGVAVQDKSKTLKASVADLVAG